MRQAGGEAGHWAFVGGVVGYRLEAKVLVGVVAGGAGDEDGLHLWGKALHDVHDQGFASDFQERLVHAAKAPAATAAEDDGGGRLGVKRGCVRDGSRC